MTYVNENRIASKSSNKQNRIRSSRSDVTPSSVATPIRIGVSSCLLGQNVRYDGGHKRDSYIVRTLGRYVELLPVCPEVGIGLGVPRAPIHLVNRRGTIRAVGRDDPLLDVTAALNAYGATMARSLDGVSGYLFKQRSPSCGLKQVPVYGKGGVRAGRGVYADAFLQAHPWLPAAEEGELADPVLRDSFLERVFAYRRWQDLVARGISVTRLTEFHAAHTLALMAHRPRSVAELGRLLARTGPIDQVAGKYIAKFMRILLQPATPARHETALLHMLGYLKKTLSQCDKIALRNAIRRFRAGELPRSAVLLLLRRHFRRHLDVDIQRQTYLYPSTNEKALRQL